MRVIFLPSLGEMALIAGVLVVVFLAFVIYQWIRPPALEKLAKDERYTQALEVFAAALPKGDAPSHEERRSAMISAIEYLAKDHGIAAQEAERNLWVVVAEYDKERSYELRHEAITFEQAGAYDLALELFERAARWREESDREDYEFLQRSAARVRSKVRPR